MIWLDVEALSAMPRKMRRLKVHFTNHDIERLPLRPLIKLNGYYPTEKRELYCSLFYYQNIISMFI